MRKQAAMILFGILLLSVLFACGGRKKPAAPMGERNDLVQSKLTAMPEELGQVYLLGRAGGILLGTESGQVYEVQGGAYRSVENQKEVLAVAAGPEGDIWTALYGEDGCTLVKTNGQGTVLSQLEVGQLQPVSMVTTTDGRVFLSAGKNIHVFSAEGVKLGVVTLETSKQVYLAACGNRVFARWWELGKTGTYVEILPDLGLGAPFSGVVSGSEVWPLGSFLSGYLVMEKDDVGLYAFSEDGVWETVCLWEDLHLNGSIDARLLSDSQGGGLALYEAGGTRYCLRVYEK